MLETEFVMGFVMGFARVILTEFVMDFAMDFVTKTLATQIYQIQLIDAIWCREFVIANMTAIRIAIWIVMVSAIMNCAIATESLRQTWYWSH